MKAKIESDVDLDVSSVYSVICFDLDEIRHRDLKSDETVFMTKKIVFAFDDQGVTSTTSNTAVHISYVIKQ